MRRATLLAMALLCATLAAADGVRFDMGGPSTPLAPGYTRVTPADMLADGKAFGWTKAPMTFLFRGEPTNPYLAQGPTGPEFSLLSDAVLSLEENTFVFMVPPGRYAVTAIIGDLALGEGRPGQSIWANDALVADKVSTDASVKAFTFPVDAAGGRIELRFRSDSTQRYVTVEAVVAEPLPAGRDLAVTMKQYPEGPVPVETYRANWQAVQEALLADWAQAKRELAAEGVDLAYWQSELARLRKLPGYRTYWGWSLGGGAWDRLAQKIGTLDLSALLAAYREMGLDGFSTNQKLIADQLRAAGFGHAVSGHAEAFPGNDTTGITLNLMRNADGTTTTVDKVWSNCAPEARAAFTKLWQQTPGETARGAEFFLIDEPRGMWGAGRYGDVSAPAQAEFQRWCEAQGYRDLLGKPIPDRGRTLAFYRFYQFRLQSVAAFMQAAVKGAPVETIPSLPGNGNVGPEQMNHSCLWPPALAQAGMQTACWAYDNPASCKMYAETIRIAEEYSGQDTIVPPQYPEAHTAVQDRPMNTACISALNTRVMPWHFNGPTVGPDRVERMKNVLYASRLTHATSGLRRAPLLYVWCPESLVYNDLVEMNEAEKGNWRKVWQALFDANLDYSVTNTLAVPRNSVVLYACARPVLNAEEFARLQKFVSDGGTLLCAFAGTPELPDGTPLAAWGRLPQQRLVRVTLEPAALQQALAGRPQRLAWTGLPPAVKLYRYVTEGEGRAYLLNNTDLEAPATVKLPAALHDMLSGRNAGTTVTIPPGGYALLSRS